MAKGKLTNRQLEAIQERTRRLLNKENARLREEYAAAEAAATTRRAGFRVVKGGDQR